MEYEFDNASIGRSLHKTVSLLPQYQRAGIDLILSPLILINTGSIGNVMDLVFIECPALLEGKIIPRGVGGRRIDHPWLDIGLPCTVQVEPPVLVFLSRVDILKKLFH